MDKENLTMWGIHSRNEYLFTDEKNSLVAIGWEQMGQLTKIEPNRESYKKVYKETYCDAKPGAISNSAGQLYRFVVEMKVGDYIIFPCRLDRMVYIGEIISDYYYAGKDEIYPNRRKVKWVKKLPRTTFSQGALYEIGSAMSLFTVKNYVDEFWAATEKGYKVVNQTNEEDGNAIELTTESILEGTKDFVLKELSKHLKGYSLEKFVADLLNAMGYKTMVSKQGGDSGVDIIAYRDELPPRVLVQVKSGDVDIKEQTLQSLKGAMSAGDYGLFVTLTGYTKKAKDYLKHQPIIKALDGSEFVDLILKYYDRLSKEFKKMIPLSKVYIPDAKEVLAEN